ncbi:hypothetical protein MNBD_GAMMA15-1187 [hydrothermal vent metagenome]|uniref:Uncharacterized protein n=1 Tax=hydrothermal vent metagenome TaxID=652676 RepID=A0A3B0YV17_9ZZZZ
MRNTHLSPSAGKQRGAALLIFVIALVMAASYALLKKVNQVPSDASRDTYSMQQLKIARDALRGYALHGLDPVTATVQPGRLPCPDYGTSGNLDGISDPCIIVGTYVRPGRLPWRTLGLAELRDGDNEPLWYVPDIQFNGSVAINSSSDVTTLRVNASVDDIIAIVLSPGAVLASQSRPSGNLVAQLDPARYFEDINSLAATNYVTAPASISTPFNDRLLTIRLNRFMPKLEKRVLRELANLLGSPPYPAPAPIGSETCDISPPIDQEGLVPTICATATLPTFPSWFNDINAWQTLIWYAVASSGTLTVEPSSVSTQALLFSPGAQLTGQNRTPVINSASDLLDDGVNTDGNTTYLEPINSATNNDQLLILGP